MNYFQRLKLEFPEKALPGLPAKPAKLDTQVKCPLDDEPPSPCSVREMLDSDPSLHIAYEVVDPDSDPVRVTIAIRDIGTCDLLIARDRWDPFEFLKLIQVSESTSQ